jgi:hypothetical protein
VKFGDKVKGTSLVVMWLPGNCHSLSTDALHAVVPLLRTISLIPCRTTKGQSIR